jgi:membrane-bound lytic murein transglycosylase D
MNYVPLYLAALIIAKNPDVFDYAMQDSLVYDPDTVTVNDCVEMKTIAEGINYPLDSLNALNPQILHWCTPPDLQNVRLYVPKGYADAFNAFYDSLPDEKKTKFYRYKIQHGDNLMQIARNFRVPVAGLREINKMKNNYISAGRYLIIPVPVNDSVPASLAKHLNASEREKPHSAQSRKAAAPRTGKKVTYKVRAGETLYSISQTFGVSVNDLLSWNYLASPRSLKAEQTLVIYQKDDSAAPQTQTASHQRVRGNASEHTGKRLVRQGDTLYSIAIELGLTVSELAKINGLDARRPLIFPGDVLVYTPKSAPAGGSE